MPSKRVWRSGPPPHKGWWNASVRQDQICWRWWDGRRWSEAAFPDESADVVGRRAATTKGVPRKVIIQWSDYWPENARVPRIKP